MPRILKRYVTRDIAGHVIASQTERLTDDGAGHINVNSERTTRRCSGCRRPLLEASELRGICDWCLTRECCIHCNGKCHVCSRALCGQCRQGFAGPPAVTVCPECQWRLLSRQVRQDRLESEQVEFERHLSQQRLVHQFESLRLAAERTRIMARLQAARLGLVQPSIMRQLWRLARYSGRKLFQVSNNVGRRLLQ